MVLRRLFILLCSLSSIIMANAATVDYFGFDKVNFNGENYILSWSAHSPANTYIEDFLPKNSSLTHFEKKVSVYLLKNADLSLLINQKIDDLTVSVTEKQIDTFHVDSTKTDDMVIDYVAQLNQGGTLFVAQNTILRYVKQGDDVVLIEWQQRVYDDFSSFIKKSAKKREDWLKTIKKYSIPSISIHN